MPKLIDRIVAIVEEFNAIQKRLPLTLDDYREFGIPGLIDANNGHSIITSRLLEAQIVAVADQLMETDPSLLPKVTTAEWRNSVRRAFGPALASIDYDQAFADSAVLVLSEIKKSLSKRVDDFGVHEFAFGCTLFGNEGIKPFAIGPVRFELRGDWIARKKKDGDVTATTRARVEKAWSGQNQKRRKVSADSIRERDILTAIGSCPFVCSVSLNGFGDEAALDKALVAARLALAGIALQWASSSGALDGMNLIYDREIRRRSVLKFIPHRIVLAGYQLAHLPHGPTLEAGEWEKVFASRAEQFRIVGEILSYTVDLSGAVKRPKLMSALAQALLWFHEGCRESVTLMAIVKFTAALDALALAKQAPGILKIVQCRLGIEIDKPMYTGGPTAKEAVKRMYSDARSRTVHGTNDKLGHDWSNVRGVSEFLARSCLLACIDWAAKNSSDDPKLLSSP